MNPEIRKSLYSMLTDERKNRIEHVIAQRSSNIVILLDRVFHAHNIAAVLRSADAFGINTIHIVEPEITHPENTSKPEKSPGISMGSEKWLNIIKHNSTAEAINLIRQQGFKVVTLCPPPVDSSKLDRSSLTNAVCVTELPFEDNLCLVFGSELEGISDDIINKSDLKAYIPMFGFVESFNISVACALTLFCSHLPKVKPVKRTLPLNEETQSTLRDDWIKKSIPKIETIYSNLQQRLQKNEE